MPTDNVGQSENEVRAMLDTELFSLKGRLAVVGGGAGSIGCASAEILLQAGAKVVLFDLAEDRLKEAQEALAPFGPVTLLAGDTTKQADIDKLADLTKSMGGADILVNSVGVQRRKPILEATSEDLEFVWSVNVAGVFRLTQTLIHQMVEKKYGKIINLCSIGSFVGLDQKTIYAITKGGLLQYTRSSAVELAKYGVRVNAIAPGYVDTAMTHSWIHSEREAEYLARIPLGRYATVDDLKGTFAFLAAPASDYMTGQMLVLDGGWTIW
jgi:NAD(P)-dependent dehydrogenase (short-subunit alcohol dehydrogenase family)